MKRPINVRFAPSPTGHPHLGNVRAALMNYLFARRNDGTFIVRVEDTDQARTPAGSAQTIHNLLAWLSLSPDKGPADYEKPDRYFQSQRTDIYQAALDKLIEKKLVYRCFSTEEELTQATILQKSRGLAPRYDRRWRDAPEEKIQQALDSKTPFAWRLKLPLTGSVDVNDCARGLITFELENFSDFPLTRRDGSFTFLFTNAVDDIDMDISHVIRGNDHLSNSALQVSLVHALEARAPYFWHLPMIINQDGKKLSKRDKGFSVSDLQADGFLPEAISNYLLSLGTSLDPEVQSLDELIASHPLAKSDTSTITYDPDKLLWFNREWINRIGHSDLVSRIESYRPDGFEMNYTLEQILELCKTDIDTLKEFWECARMITVPPHIQAESFHSLGMTFEEAATLCKTLHEQASVAFCVDDFLQHVRQWAKESGTPLGKVFKTLRIALVGVPQGFDLKQLCPLLGLKIIKQRLEKAR